VLKPPPLRPGDVVGIVAPASNVDREALERGCARLRELGYQPYYLDSILDRDLYFAGSLERRVRELHEMFTRPEVRAIICARGGYGCNYLLPHLDLELIRQNPKVLVGYSDITALLTYLHDATGLVTFHGPMAVKDFGAADGIEPASWNATTTGAGLLIPGESKRGDPYGIRELVRGSAKGRLYGGCLSILCASLGTKYEVNTDDTILFLEDMNEKPYQIDRMLVQLGRAGKLSHVRGILFGEMLGCSQQRNNASGWGTQPGQDYTLEEVVGRVLAEFAPAVPVAFGLRSGHVSRANVMLPLGVTAELHVMSQTGTLVCEASTANNAVRAEARS
jgi:muramoyltetrapeptide carboxypeptidase